MERIEEILDGVKTMGIGGHVRPDGDCVGSCMALYLYIKKWYPEIKADIIWRSRSRYSDILHAWMRYIMKQVSPESMIFL